MLVLVKIILLEEPMWDDFLHYSSKFANAAAINMVGLLSE